ncbi:MAG: D-aminoacyl-tRNA deacylase [Steroidobacteraceae bacterium]
MIFLLQRVTEARIHINGELTASIGPGLLVLVGVRPGDDEPAALRLLSRLLAYRVFPDAAGKMNLSLRQTAGELLLVPQFTLAADTRHGLRPGFSTAAPPEHGRRLFDALVVAARAEHAGVSSGVFGTHMQVSLTNDGPVTLWLES